MAKIIVDLDGTLVNTNAKLLDLLSEKYPEADYTEEDIDHYNFDKCVQDRHKDELWNIYGSQDFYDNGVHFYSGAKEAVTKLADDHTVILVSKPMNGHIESKHRLMDSLKEEMDIEAYFLGEKREHIDGHILIDDKPDHIRNFSGVGFLHSRPYNEGEEFKEPICRFTNWGMVPRLVEGSSRIQLQFERV